MHAHTRTTVLSAVVIAGVLSMTGMLPADDGVFLRGQASPFPAYNTPTDDPDMRMPMTEMPFPANPILPPADDVLGEVPEWPAAQTPTSEYTPSTMESWMQPAPAQPATPMPTPESWTQQTENWAEEAQPETPVVFEEPVDPEMNGDLERAREMENTKLGDDVRELREELRAMHKRIDALTEVVAELRRQAEPTKEPAAVEEVEAVSESVMQEAAAPTEESHMAAPLPSEGTPSVEGIPVAPEPVAESVGLWGSIKRLIGL